MVLLHPDDGSVESWTAEGSSDKMRADFAGWEPRYVLFRACSFCSNLRVQNTKAPIYGPVCHEVETDGPSTYPDVDSREGTACPPWRLLPPYAG